MRRVNGDAGATTVLVALLLPVILLGFGALALDVGSMHLQKRQLQNGADAAALGVARDCASDPDLCTQSIAETSADLLAAANGNGGPGNLGAGYTELLCGTIPGLSPCPAAFAPDPATVGPNYYVKARTSGWNAPLLSQFLGNSGREVRADATAALAERRGLVGAKAPFALCVENTEVVPGYPVVGATVDPSHPGYPGAVNVPLLTGSYPSYQANEDAVGQKYPLWSNGNSEANAATNKCGLGSSWKGWIDDEVYTLPDWVDSGSGSAVGDLTYLTEALPTCQIDTNNGKITGDCRFIIPLCTTDRPGPIEGDIWCPVWGAFEFTDIKPVDSTEPNGWKTIYGEFLGGRQVDGGEWTTEEPADGQPYVLVPRMIG